jgi:two-component system, cell cycle sensor histidine kinase and response regulator CckA
MLDVVMPAMTGPEAFEKMSALKPGLRALFTTGYTTEGDALRSMIRSGVSFLQKPYSSRELGRGIRSLLDKIV